MAAEIIPLFNAVKKEEPQTLKPIKRKESAYNRNPLDVISNNSTSYFVKIPIKGLPKNYDNTTRIIAVSDNIVILFLNRFFNSELFFAP